MGTKIDAVARVLLAMRYQRELRREQLETTDYAITVMSAKAFFDTFEFLLKQELAKDDARLVEHDTKEDISTFIERYRGIAREVLVNTLIEHGTYTFSNHGVRNDIR